MEKLRDRIEKSKIDGKFDIRPPSGHKSRFRKRLLDDLHANANQNKEVKLWPFILAAVCILGVISTLVIQNIQDANTVNSSLKNLSDVGPEMSQMEHFYTDAIDERLKELNPSDPSIRKQIQEFKKLEKEYDELTGILNLDFGNKKIVEAMIENYKLRLKVLEGILMRIELNKKIKSTNPENNKSHV